MKKRIKVILAIFIALAVLAIAALGVWFGINQKQAQEVMNEVEWYNLEDKEFTITTAEELYKVAALSQYYDFKGQTIFLGADIAVNEGNAAQWGESAPERVWVPIKGFAGTFDGKGHTISGIYAVGVNKSVGLFTDTDAVCEIKDLRIENSYIKGLNDKGTGSVIGAGTGTLSSVYSNAIVVCESDNAGGLVGYWKSKKTSGMENCWFDGSVQSTSELSHYTGGLIGRVLANASICKIEHCLNTAEVTSVGQEVGGLIGAVAGETTMWLTDSLNAGKVNAPEGSLTAGLAIGKLYGSASVNSKTSWVVKANTAKTIGTTEGTVKGILADIARQDAEGVDAYINTTLDFDNHWAVVEQDTPVLAYFTQNAPSIAGLERKYDLSWYDEKQTQLHISTVAQLNGFALLSQAYGFSGQTIILDNDLVLNEGDASDWAKRAPENEWEMPIGRWISEDGVTSGVAFSGTFDGNGHTISGLYVSLDSTKAYNWGLFAKTKGTIKNLRLENSYIGGVAGGNVGSIAGGLEGGTIENVYSNAILDMDTWRIGGLTGIIEGRSKTSTIKNSWFDGSVTGRERVGGFVGNINQDVGLVIEHGLNTGTITGTSHYIGGLVGIINKCTASITDSLNTGSIQRAEGNRTGYYGAISGGVNGEDGLECEATMKNVFFLDDSCAKGYQEDKNHTDYITIIGQGAIQLNKEELTGNSAYVWSSLNFKEYWTTVSNDTPVLRTFAQKTQQASGTKMVDYSWYSVSGTNHSIKNAKQLWAFSILSRTDDFKNKTVKLTADITINDTGKANWYEANLRNWKPIGRNVTQEGDAIGKAFAGTFDGKGHKITGLYIKLNSTKAFNWGLFAKTSGTIQNLRLVDCHISGVAGGSVGSVAGSLAGATMKNVYSNATVSITSGKANTGKNIAGLAGIIEGKASSTITNCWFDGSVSGVERVGGFAGSIDALSTLTLSHGLNTGSVASSSNYIGGFVGLMNKSGLTVSDSLNTGSITTTSKTSYIGAIAGGLNGTSGKEGNAKFTDVYFLKDSSTKAYQVDGNNKAFVAVRGNGAVLLNEEELTGNNAYVWSMLDFDQYWTTVDKDMPMLRTFAKKTQKVSADKMVAFDWHALDATSHKIGSAEDLWGLTLLSRTDSFAGETIKLTADIQLDETDWQPIGKHEVTGTDKPGQVFAGTFDGAKEDAGEGAEESANHTISGLTMVLESGNKIYGLFGQVSGTVRNITLDDVSITGTASGKVGSVAGVLAGGTLENVNSTANVDVSSNFVGGLVGSVEGSNKATIANSTFTTPEDGKVEGSKHVGGLVGYVNASSLDITGSENNGAVSTKVKDSNVGGLIGYVQRGTAVITGSKNNGAVSLKGFTGNLGTIIGRIDGDANGSAAVTFDDVTNTKTQEPSRVAGYNVDAEDLVADANGNAFVTITGEITDIGNPPADALDTSWYDPAKGTAEDPYIIADLGDLLGLAQLAQENDFAGKTIKLAADIDLTDISWTPIGQHKNGSNATVGVVFAGTFDGDDHTISGLTIAFTGKEGYQGLFGTVSGTIKNLVLADATISGTASNNRIGSVAGALKGGTLESIHSTAAIDVSANFVGGLVGSVEGSDKSTIKNCSFSGTAAGNKHVGGIAGYINTSKLDVIDCENNGAVSTKVSDGTAGGLIGYAQKSTLALKDSTNNGAVSYASAVTEPAGYVATIIGRIEGTSAAKATVTLEHVSNTKEHDSDVPEYTVTGAAANSSVTYIHQTVHVAAVTPTCQTEGNVEYWYCSTCNAVWLDELLTQITTLEQTKLGVGDHSYVDGTCSVCGAADPGYAEDPDKLDTSWYDPAKGTAEDPYLIANKGDLLGLAELAKTNDFTEKTVKLTADIDLSEDAWAPIGQHKNGSNQTVGVVFAGTFDGDNHTISGMTVEFTGKEGYQGLFGTVSGTVKNLKLTGVSISGTAANNRIGAVAGMLKGATLENVQVTASVNAAANFVGGLVGSVEGSAKSTIKNCTFAGSVEGNKHIGGFVGYVNASSVEITGSENKGSVTTKQDDNGGVGGLIGYAQKSAVSIADSKNSGTVTPKGSLNNTGTLVGRIEGASAAKATLTLACTADTSPSAYTVTGTSQYTTVTVVHAEILTVAAVAPTCEAGGNVKYWCCSDCEVLWLDEALTQATDAEAVKLSAKGHSYTDDICSVCGKIDPDSSTPDTGWYDAEADTYTLSSKAALYGLAKLAAEGNTFAGKTVQLAADIDLTDEIWVPIKAFSGTFDGANYTIKNVVISDTTDGVGFFKKVASGTVKDLVLQNVTISATKNKVGAVTGTLEKSTLQNVHASGTINTTGNQVGGLAGQIDGSNVASVIKNCSYKGAVTGAKNIGGIAGFSSSALICLEDCLNQAAVTVTASGGRVGGLVGYAQSAKTGSYIKRSLNTGTVAATNGTTNKGALVGVMTGTLTFENAYYLQVAGLNATNSATDPSGCTAADSDTLKSTQTPVALGFYPSGAWVRDSDGMPILKTN